MTVMHNSGRIYASVHIAVPALPKSLDSNTAECMYLNLFKFSVVLKLQLFFQKLQIYSMHIEYKWNPEVSLSDYCVHV